MGKPQRNVKSKHWSWAVCGKSKIVIISQLSRGKVTNFESGFTKILSKLKYVKGSKIQIEVKYMKCERERH